MHLGIDIGLTTGFALVTSRSQLVLVESHLMKPPERERQIERWQTIADLFAVEDVLLECPVIFQGLLGRELEAITNQIRLAFPDHREVKPGQWKTSAVKTISLPGHWGSRRLVSHDYDAIRIAYWGAMTSRTEKTK